MSREVQALFSGIAPTYDRLNRILSLGIDQGWRRRAVAALGPIARRQVLDLCAGTLDLSVMAAAAGARVVACDFALPMLARGREKQPALPLVCADALQLPFADASFDGLLCGFGLRNLDDTGAALAEMRRLLRPGGRLALLDFFRPARPVARAMQTLYNERLLPLVGGAVSGNQGAYRYLAQSIERFASRREVEALLGEVGFGHVAGTDLSFGIAALVVATR